MHGLPRDDRTLSWAELEGWISERASKRDPNWRPFGAWKHYLREQDGFVCYAVDGLWLYNNLTVLFGHGGHGYVHECIPLDEIWVAEEHTARCAYEEEDKQAHARGKPIEARERDCIVVHEIAEFRAMQSGASFWVAHNKALEVEEQWLASNAR